MYNGAGNSVTVAGLTPGSTYYFSVIEYNGFGASINYLNTSTANSSAVAANFNINISGLQTSICLGEVLTLQASGALTYSWSPSGDLSSSSSASVTATPRSTTYYTVDAVNAQGCHALRNFTITVNPLPTINFPDLRTACVNDPAVLLNMGTPSGGIYSGTGVNNGVFNPANAGVGTFTLLYEFTDVNGCTSASVASINVKSIPSVNLGSDMLICAGNFFVVNAGTGFSSYLWSNGSTGSSLRVDSNGTGLGMINVFVKVSNLDGCFDSDTVQLIFDPCNGISSIEVETLNINIFPNPFFKDFTCTTSEPVSFCIYDMLGRILEKRGKTSQSFTAGENFVPGVYFIELASEKKRKVFSVLKSE